MLIMTFDTLNYAKKLQNAGLTAQQAEIQAEALKEIIEDKITSKRDLKDLRKDLTIRMGAMLTTAVGILSLFITLLNKLH